MTKSNKWLRMESSPVETRPNGGGLYSESECSAAAAAAADHRTKTLARIKVALVSMTLITSALVLLFTVVSISNGGRPQILPVLRIAKHNVNSVIEATATTTASTRAPMPINESSHIIDSKNTTIMTIFDELTVSNYTDLDMTSPNDHARMLDDKNTPVEDANALRYFVVLDKRKKEPKKNIKSRGREPIMGLTDRSYYERSTQPRLPMQPQPKYPSFVFRDHRYHNPEHYPPTGLFGYTPIPSFSENYAQLEPYRGPPSHIKSIQEMIKYLKDEKKLLKQAVKFAGVYMKTPDGDDSNSEASGSKPFLNGHAYVADPFVKYKPSNPSEINQLASPSPPPIDLSGRFSNRHPAPELPQLAQQDTFFPSMPPPTGAAPPVSSLGLAPMDHNSPGYQTQAIFHPYYTPYASTPSTKLKRPSKKPKPFSVMLDIYPVEDQSTIQQPILPIGGQIGSIPTPTRPTGPKSNRMVVRLNLYPKKTSKVRTRPTDHLASIMQSGSSFQQRSYEDPIDTQVEQEPSFFPSNRTLSYADGSDNVFAGSGPFVATSGGGNSALVTAGVTFRVSGEAPSVTGSGDDTVVTDAGDMTRTAGDATSAYGRRTGCRFGNTNSTSSSLEPPILATTPLQGVYAAIDLEMATAGDPTTATPSEYNRM